MTDDKVSENLDPLQLILVKVIARAAIPLGEVQQVVGNRPKRIKAFNLFDGSHTLTEVARQSKVSKGNLSTATKRWIASGVMYRLGPGRDAKLVHVYPILTVIKRRPRR